MKEIPVTQLNGQRRVVTLMIIMAAACMAVAAVSMIFLYSAAVDQQSERLKELAKNRAVLIAAMTEHEFAMEGKGPKESDFAITLHQLEEARNQFEGFGRTGEFSLARKEAGRIVFLLDRRHGDTLLDPVPFSSDRAEPMRRALSGLSGVMTGKNYEGATVLAAYEPIPAPGLGLVAEIHLAELRAPFVLAALLTAGVTVLMVLLGAYFFRRVSDPMVLRLEDHAADLEREVEERKQAQEALGESRRAMETLLGNLPGMAYRCANNPDWPMEFVSDGCRTLTGYAPGDLMGAKAMSFALLIPSQDRDRVWETVQKAVRENIPFQVEYRIRTREGGEKWVWERGRPVPGNPGEPVALEGFILDITERKQAEQELSESEERFRRAIDFTPFPIMIHAEDGEVIHVNEAWARITGRSQEDIPTISEWAEKAFGDDRKQEVLDGMGKLYGLKKGVHEGESILATARGENRVWDFFAAPLGVLPDGRRAVLSIALDVTDQKQAEEQLRQAQKMEAVGRLAGGVAHDFNNMLNIILGYAEMAMENLPPDSEIREDIQEIEHAAMRSADLTRQLLAFSRKQIVEPRVVNINRVLEEQWKMLSRLIGEDIRMEFHPGPDLWNVCMDPSQMDQILANLSVNARDAIAGVGAVTIETENVVLDETFSSKHLEAVPGEYVMIAFSDTGTGMDEATVERIFEPFFTTKERDRGTGLGLSTVYGIVKQNKGVVHVYSEPGLGTTFTMYFPRFQGEAPEAKPPVETKTLGGTETVLVVEDQDQVLNLAKSALSMRGYKVLAARTPGEALELAQAHEGAIHLLLTDVIMPSMNGKELAELLSAREPGLKTLFMSGYTANVIAHHGVLDEGIQFLQKPFSIHGLTAKVRNVLDS
ncbi:MAG: PAS domain S-box protein [Pseudomonadota bacterium]